MKNKLFKTEISNARHFNFGGTVYQGDFDEYHSMSDMASRILSDWSFDKQCQKNREERKNQTDYRNGMK